MLFGLYPLFALVAGTAASQFDESRYSAADVIVRDVLVVGGGSAGIHAAVSVHDANRTVAVVEKQAVLGGATNTFVDPTSGQPINVGVQLLHNDSVVLAYCARLAVPLRAAGALDAVGASVFADFASGARLDGLAQDGAATGAALAAWAQLIATNFSSLVPGYFLPDPVPEALLLPFGDFIEQAGLQALAFTVFSSLQEGNIAALPTVYVMRQFGPALVQAFAQGLLTTPDLHLLYDNAAVVLGSANVFVNASILATKRTGKGVKVLVKTPKGIKLFIAKKLLMTGPPLLDNLRGWDLSREERGIFGKLSAVSYFAGILKSDSKTLNASESYINISPAERFGLPTFPGAYAIGAVRGLDTLHTVYYGDETVVSASVAKKGIRATLNRLTRSGVLNGSDVEFAALFDHSPFRLTFPVSDIRNGVYARFNNLQGSGSTWWAGAVLSAHDSSAVWAFNEQFVLPGLLKGL